MRWIASATSGLCLALSCTVSPLPASARFVGEIFDVNEDGVGDAVAQLGVVISDGGGTLFAADSGADKVYRVDSNGVVSVVIDASGDGTGNVLKRPAPLAVDSLGNLYVAGGDSDNVFRVTPGGIVTQVLDASGIGAPDTFEFPWDMVVDGSDNVFVSGRLSDNVFKITPAGVASVVIDATGDGAGHPLMSPEGMAFDPAGNLYVASGLHSGTGLFRITPGGIVTHVVSGGSFRTVVTDGLGNAYVPGAFKVAPDDTVTQIIDANGDGVHPLLDNRAIAVDAAGNAFVTGTESDNVFHIAPDGTITQVLDASGDGTASLEFPIGVVTDADGNVYVAGVVSHNVFRITPSGDVVQVLGPEGHGPDAALAWPNVTIAPDGALLVSGVTSENVFRFEFRCAPSPQSGCRQPTLPAKAKLQLLRKAQERGDRIKWTWASGEETLPGDFGSPLTNTTYAACLYGASNGLVTEGVAVPGGTCGVKPCWSDRGSKGLRYYDKSSEPTGIRKMTLKPGDAGKAKVRVAALGLPVMAPPLPLALPLTMQLQASNGQCWEAIFSTAITSDSAIFKAKSD